MSEAPTSSFIWLEELLKDPSLLEMPKPIASRFVWPNRITLLAAREKGGKSTLAGAIAASVSSGRPFLGEEVMPGNVLIVSLEEHPQDFVTRLVGFGCDASKVAIVTQKSGDLIKDIWDACEEVQPKLIIWDTLGAFADHICGEVPDPGNSAEWTRIMRHIVEVSREFGASLILHHSRKSDGKYRDSTAIGANVDVILEMHGEGTAPRLLKPQARGGLLNEDFKIRLDDNTYALVETEKEFRERVLKFIQAHPKCGMRELREGIPGRGKEVDAARDHLLSKGLILNVGGPAKHEYVARKT